jgi:hypothetical protein
MNGNNTTTAEGFVKNLSHPRKKELATMLLNGTTIEALSAASFGRINVIEMARDIRRSVLGMEDFSFDYPRNVEQNVSAPKVAVTNEASADTSNDSPVPNPSAEGDGAPVATPAPEVPQPTPVDPAAQTETVGAGFAAPVAQTEPAAPVAPAVPEVTNPGAPIAPTA